MNKDYVLGLLRTTWNNYMVCCLTGFLLDDIAPESIPTDLELVNLSNPTAKVILHLEQMKTMLLSKEKTKKLLSEHMKSALRSFIKDSFETVNLYANETMQFHRMQKASWYEFTRVIRNNLAHDFRFRFRKRDLKVLPVKWRDIEITKDMDNQTLPVEVMNEANAMCLFKDIFGFVENEFD